MPRPGRGPKVCVPALLATKVYLHNEMLEQDVTKAELGRRLKQHMPQIDRLVDDIDAAAKAKGRRRCSTTAACTEATAMRGRDSRQQQFAPDIRERELVSAAVSSAGRHRSSGHRSPVRRRTCSRPGPRKGARSTCHRQRWAPILAPVPVDCRRASRPGCALQP
jgi:hypothetical protein